MKKESYISPKKLLSEQEYENYKRLREEQEKRKLNKKITNISRENKYYSQKPSKIGKGIQRGIGVLRSPTNFLYKRSNNLPIARTSYGKKGRPKGSYDSRYKNYGGVYGYRRQLNAGLKVQKMEALRRASINPEQQRILNQVQARDNYNRTNPEARTIPDTRGNIDNLSSINKEINDACNLVN